MPTYHAYCKGINFRGPEVRSFCAELEYPATAVLEREPDNKHDENAIKIHIDEIFVGYLAKEIAEFIAPKIDAGETFNVDATGTEEHGKALWLALIIEKAEPKED